MSLFTGTLYLDWKYLLEPIDLKLNVPKHKFVISFSFWGGVFFLSIVYDTASLTNVECFHRMEDEDKEKKKKESKKKKQMKQKEKQKSSQCQNKL